MRIGGYSTPIRISGLNSGLDTDSIVSQLMQVEQLKVNKLTSSKTKLEWKNDAYNSVIQKVQDFSNKYLSALSSDNIISNSAFTTYNSNYTANKYFKVTGSNNIIPGKYSVSSIKVATGAKISGTTGNSKKTQFVGSFKNFLETKTESSELKDNLGNEITADTKLSEIVNAEGNSAFGFSDTITSIQFKANGKTFTFNKDATVNDMMSQINSSDAGINASLQNGKITFASDNTITFNNIIGTSFGTNGAFGISEGTQTRTLKFDGTATLGGFETATGKKLVGADNKLSFSINGENFSFDETSTINDVINTVNASSAGVSMSFNSENGDFSVRSTNANTSIEINNISGNLFGDDSVVGITGGISNVNVPLNANDTFLQAAQKLGIDLGEDADGNISFKLNGKEFVFGKDTTLNSAMTQINGSNLGVKMYYSSLTDGFEFASTSTGINSKIEFEAGNGNLFGSGSLFGISQMNATGSDASITINGETIVSETNSITIDGMNFELTDDFTADANQDAYDITFTQNNDDAVNKVKNFVEAYNSLVKDLNSLLKESKDYNYTPLTDAQKEEMSEKEIENWETEAKKGLLRNDSAISNLLTTLRGSLFSVVGETGLMPSDIGISTAVRATDGTISLDEDVLRQALNKDPEAVANVFTNLSKATDQTQKYNENGYANRINDALYNFRTNVRGIQIKENSTQISKLETSIKDMNEKLAVIEQRYWNKFTQLETAMSNLNSQQEWLSSQLASL